MDACAYRCVPVGVVMASTTIVSISSCEAMGSNPRRSTTSHSTSSSAPSSSSLRNPLLSVSNRECMKAQRASCATEAQHGHDERR